MLRFCLRSSSYAWLVFAVYIFSRYVPFFSSSGPRCSTSWLVWTRRTATQRGLAALVVVAAVACLLLVCWCRCHTRCVPFDGRRLVVTGPRGTDRGGSDPRLLFPAPSVFACTVVRAGLRAFSSSSLEMNVSAAAMVSQMLSSVWCSPCGELYGCT